MIEHQRREFFYIDLLTYIVKVPYENALASLIIINVGFINVERQPFD